MIQRILCLFLLCALPALAQEATGGPVPKFSFPHESGAISAEGLKGKVILINCWATWCGPCMGEMPDLVKLQEKYKDQGLQLVGISYDQSEEQMKKGAERLQLNFPVVMHDLPEVQSFLEKLPPVEGIPTTWVIDPDGTIVAHHIGAQPLEAFEALVKPHLPKP
ncbi:MAG: TlpA family protein disulfide reductase [Vulcanimicrobiota bacterium]